MPKLQYDNPDVQSVLDDEGNSYTPAQVRAAAEQMTRDEAGHGTLGGLTEGDTGEHLATQGTPTTPAPANKREMDPRNFGDFFKSNIFGGLDAKYVTGKRPMTAFDYITDAAAAYGGENIGKRNAGLIKGESDRLKNERENRVAESTIKTQEATRQKTGLETQKLAGAAIQRMMHDLDSDLWGGELKSLQKEHGIALRPGVTSMVERMAQKMSEAGVKHPSEVLDTPDRFDPALVNRVRHTMTILNKDIEESQGRQLEQEKSKQALGMREGTEQRNQEKFNRSEAGTEDAIKLLMQQADTEDPTARRKALGQIATLRQGGTAAQKVLEDLSGVGSPTQGRSWIQTRDAAIAAIQKRQGAGYQPGPDEVKAEMNKIEASGAGQRTQATKAAGLVAEGKAQVARGLGLLDTMRQATKKYGLASGAFESTTVQPLRMLWSALTKDPTYSTLQAFPATMSNISRSLGERGVLTDKDLERVIAATQPRKTDTIGSYEARMKFVETAMKRGQIELEKAEANGTIPTPANLDDLTFDGDPLPTESAGGAEGGEDQASAAAAVRAEKDPTRKKAMAADYVRKFPR